MEVLFLSRVLKKNLFFLLNFCYLLCSLLPHHFVIPPPTLISLLFCQVEFKMKKTEAIRWEKLEGEGQESNIKHFNPS